MTKLNREHETKQMNEVATIEIEQRFCDGYVNATALCKREGKQLKHYLEIMTTKEFLKELSRSVGITTDVLVSKVMTGPNELRGTWVHPYVAINLGQWLSPEFAVKVSKLIYEWMAKGHEIELEYHKHEIYKQVVKEQGSEAGRYLSSLRWHINPAIKEKDRYFEENRQLSLFDKPKEITH